MKNGTGVKSVKRPKLGPRSFFHCSSSEKASFTKDLHLFEFNKSEIFWFLENIPEKKLLTKVETEKLF